MGRGGQKSSNFRDIIYEQPMYFFRTLYFYCISFILDMDVAECERKRYEFIDDLTDLEKQFAILREQ